jgi:hypothetical protein
MEYHIYREASNINNNHVKSNKQHQVLLREHFLRIERGLIGGRNLSLSLEGASMHEL